MEIRRLLNAKLSRRTTQYYMIEDRYPNYYYRADAENFHEVFREMTTVKL